MKFSDMMGPDDESAEQDAAAVTTDAGALPLPPIARTAPALPETPVRFGGTRSALDEAVAGLTRVSDPASPSEPPRAFGAPPGVPPVPMAPPVPEVAEVAEISTPEAEADAIVETPEADAIIDAPGADAVVEVSEVETFVDGPEAEAIIDTPETDDVVDAPTGGTIAVEPAAVEPPTGGTIGVEPAAEIAIDDEDPASPAPVELSRPAAASAFATITAPAAPEVEEPVVDAATGTDDELPMLHDVMAELAPRTQTFDELTASPAQLDATSWLEGLGSIDDDLLPR